MGTRLRAIACAILLFQGTSCLGADTPQRVFSISATGAIVLDDEPLRMALLETRTPVSPGVAVAVGLAHFDIDGRQDELQVRVLGAGSLAIGNWSLENRHMISLSSQSVERYRSRLRVVRPGLFGQPALSARAFDELFVDLDGGGIIRNNLALGIGAQLQDRTSLEAYHVWVDNRDARDTNYLLLLITLRIGSWGR